MHEVGNYRMRTIGGSLLPICWISPALGPKYWGLESLGPHEVGAYSL